MMRILKLSRKFNFDFSELEILQTLMRGHKRHAKHISHSSIIVATPKETKEPAPTKHHGKHKRSVSHEFESSKDKIFKKLKSLEHGASLSKSRLISQYTENCTAALALPVSTVDLENKKDNFKTLLDLSKENIHEHAARRVDMFFYTLIAYHKTGIIPTQGRTYLQHGRGRSWSSPDSVEHQSITQACHSSFFPSLLDETITKKDKAKICILSGTHFLDNLNSTVELPVFVNKLDDELENTYLCRKKSLNIISEVSEGKLTPVQGLTEFLKMMAQTFKDLKEKEKSRKKSNPILLSDPQHLPYKVKSHLIDIMKQGTLNAKWVHDTETVADEYVHMLLRLKPQEMKQCHTNPKMKEKLFNTKYEEIQKEILGSASEYKPAPKAESRSRSPSPSR